MQPDHGSEEANGVSLQDFQLISEELTRIEEQNQKLQSQLRVEVDHRMNRDRDVSGSSRQWQEERHRLQNEYAGQMDELQEVRQSCLLFFLSLRTSRGTGFPIHLPQGE